jgi:quercetin dioxygenase-like cupin family protein
MTTTVATDGPAPISLARNEGEAIWFLDTLTLIKASGDTTRGGAAIIEQIAPPGSGSPLHVHANEDEWFYVLSGQLTFWVGGTVITADEGSFVYGPRGVPHTFLVSSPGNSRFLIVAQPAGFEHFVRALGVPAAALTLPPEVAVPPPPERMAAAAAQHGIEILGPPGIPAQA